MDKLKVLVLFDSAGTPPADQNYAEELKKEEWKTEADVLGALNELGHDVMIFGIYDDVDILFEEIKKNRPDVVFNLTEIFLGKAYLDKNIPAMLELLRIPYTGCGPTGLMICNDKALSKKILKYHKIKVPRFYIYQKGKRVWHPKKLRFPLMVKPLHEEASTGISQASFVENEKDIAERVGFIHEKFNMHAIAEEYIDGRELYVSILGKSRLQAFPLREMKFAQVPEDEPKMATYKAKWDRKYREKWGIKNEFAGRLAEGLPEKILEICKKAYRVLLLDGYARLDLRLTENGDVYIIEANANPELSSGDEFAESAKKAGLEYTALIQNILNLAINKEII